MKGNEKRNQMREGGRLLAQIRRTLEEKISPGVTPKQLDTQAEELVKSAGGKPSFQMVPGYKHTTCISVNDGVVHGIPTDRKINEGDLVSIDIGMFFHGFHTDTATTVVAGKASSRDEAFLETGREALKKAIKKAVAGNRVGEISRTIQLVIESSGYACIRSLTGHGIGRQLHEDPPIPCLLLEKMQTTPELISGQTIAIEVIYAQGSHELKLHSDQWTLVTRDGKKAALFEETVLVTEKQPVMITAGK